MSHRIKENSPSISQQIKEMFDNAGNDVDPIIVQNQNQASNEFDYLVKVINKNRDWDDQVKGINRGMGLVNGGLLNYDSVIKELNKIGPELVEASKNLRSKLVKTSCLFLTQLARELGTKFDYLGEIIIPLSSQTSNGTQIIADSCKHTIINIVKYCHTKKIISSVFQLTTMKSPANRKIGCESLGIIIKNWEDNLIDQHIDGIKNALLKLLNDSQQETRQIARDSTTSFLQKRPELQSDFIDNLDSRMKKHIQQSPIKKRSFLPKRKGFRNPSAPKSFKKTFNNTEIRRSKSPLPMKSNKVDDKFNITLIHGREDEFLSTIENFIKNNRQSELSECIQKVVSGLGTLLVMNNESNVRRSMYIIKNLIETFPKDFEIILPQIFKVIFNNDSYDDLLKDIQSMYDPNTILYDLNHLRSTPKMIPYLAEIIQHADSDLRNGDLCESLIEMVLEFSNEEKAAATKIVQEMNKKNPDFIATVEDDFVKQAILDVPQEDDQTSFNQRDVSAWVEEIREYVSAVEEDQWNEERDILYTEIVESISQTNEKNVLFDLIIDILKSKNNDSYSQFLVVASENLRNRRVKGAKKLLQYMISTISNDEIISNVLSFLDSDQPQLNRNLLNEIAFIVNEGNAEQILPQLPSVVEVLLAFLNDEIVELRKSAVFCFVELILKFGEEMDEYFQHLTSVQQKLILFYRDMKSKE